MQDTLTEQELDKEAYQDGGASVHVYTIDELLVRTRGNMKQAAEKLGVERGTMYQWVKNKTDVIILIKNDKMIPYVKKGSNNG